MPRTIRFHLDENCTKAIANGLRLHGTDVTTTPQAGLLGAIDEEQAAYALRLGRVIFTQDRDFLRIHAARAPHAGIAYCEKDTRSVGEIIDALVLIWGIYGPDEMVGRVEFILARSWRVYPGKRRISPRKPVVPIVSDRGVEKRPESCNQVVKKDDRIRARDNLSR